MGMIKVKGASKAGEWDGASASRVPAGDYLFRIEDAKEKPSDKGNSRLNFTSMLMALADGGETEFANEKVTHGYMLGPDKSGALTGIKRLNALRKAVDIEISDNIDTEEFLGKFFIGTIQKRGYTAVDAEGNEVQKTATDLVRERAVPAELLASLGVDTEDDGGEEVAEEEEMVAAEEEEEEAPAPVVKKPMKTLRKPPPRTASARA